MTEIDQALRLATGPEGFLHLTLVLKLEYQLISILQFNFQMELRVYLFGEKLKLLNHLQLMFKENFVPCWAH